MAPTFKVTYFDIMALGEPIRILLSYGGFDWEDNRVTKENWPVLKPTVPMGQLPILEHNGKVAHQSIAICRYLGKLTKLVGKDDWEDLEIDAAADTVNDYRAKVGRYHYEADPVQKEKIGEQLFSEIVPFYSKKLDEQAKNNNGFLAVGRLTWADLLFVGLIDYMNFMAKKDLLAGVPNLQKVKENVLAVPNVKTYISNRSDNHIF
ncbi:glutathione S-transferase-like [Cylas formicarius]|uniref:glutathione S-transferase-like n=1 Tax=Cylas formicarius TaxID=197179 RepID=UPI002958632A|nr:glutathione S-transferase-like [Cylas formicarius]